MTRARSTLAAPSMRGAACALLASFLMSSGCGVTHSRPPDDMAIAPSPRTRALDAGAAPSASPLPSPSIAPLASAPPLEDCALTPDCKVNGRCTREAGTCRVSTAADCESSEVCKKGGACKLIDGVCVTGCGQLPGCKANGQCTEVLGSCSATSDLDCRASADCKTHGACTATNGFCQPGSAAECDRTEECAGHRCFFLLGLCRKKSVCVCPVGDGAPTPEYYRTRNSVEHETDDLLRAACIGAGQTPRCR